MRIEVCYDSVRIEGQFVKRPFYISRSVWMAFWDRIDRGLPRT